MNTIRTTLHVPSLSSLRLVATDLDGTLLRSDKTISDQTGAVLRRLRADGIAFVLVSARPPRVLRQLARDFHVGGQAICCNGAIIYDLDHDTVLHQDELVPHQIAHFMTRARDAVPGLVFAAERGTSVIFEAGFYPLGTPDESPAPQLVDRSAICQAPQIKLLVRHPDLSTQELYDRVVPLFDAASFSVTYSGPDFLEIMRGGVHKGEVLKAYCARLEVAAHSVVAFGDMPNDLPMLQWAGLGVAVANAHPLVLQAADEITLSNDEDGVAHMLERLLASRSTAPSAPAGARPPRAGRAAPSKRH